MVEPLLNGQGPVAPVIDSNVVIIWGMHRSGTSLLASWLRACGLDIGSELLGEGIGNERGHYEDVDFLRLHERILKANGLDRSGLIKTGPLHVSPFHLAEMRELLARKSRILQWGWKEPRTCLFAPEYLALLPRARHMVVYRHYGLVVDSLVRRHIKKRDRRVQQKAGLKRHYHALQLRLRKRFILPRLANRHLASWIKYNENLLELIQQAGPDSVFVMDCGDFVAASAPAFARLRDWGFQLRQYPAEECVDPSMIASKPARTYAFNRALLARAEEIMQRLRALSVL